MQIDCNEKRDRHKYDCRQPAFGGQGSDLALKFKFFPYQVRQTFDQFGKVPAGFTLEDHSHHKILQFRTFDSF